MTYTNTFFAVGLSEFNVEPPYKCGTDWVANSTTGIYKGNTSYWVNGITMTAYDAVTTYIKGPLNAGLPGPSWGAVPEPAKNVSLVITVPPEYENKKYYVVILADESFSNSLSYQCDNTQDNYDSIAVSEFTVNGTRQQYRLDLESYGTASDTSWENFFFRVYNRSESGVRLGKISWRYYVDRDETWFENDKPSIQIKYDDIYFLTNQNISSTWLMTQSSIPYADCSFNKKASRYIQGNMPSPVSGEAAYVVIPPGGYAETSSQYKFGPLAGNNNSMMYYSKPIDAGLVYSDYKYVTLHIDGQHVCEWESSSAQDLNQGEAPCSVTPECGVIATVSPTAVFTHTGTPTVQMTPSATYTVTAEYSFTPTATLTPTESPVPYGTPIVIGEDESYASPNPATIFVNFNYKMSKPAQKVRIDVYNYIGRNVGYVEEQNIAAGFIQIRLNLHKFAPGVYYYLLNISYSDGTHQKYKPAKFMVVKE